MFTDPIFVVREVVMETESLEGLSNPTSEGRVYPTSSSVKVNLKFPGRCVKRHRHKLNETKGTKVRDT